MSRLYEVNYEYNQLWKSININIVTKMVADFQPISAPIMWRESSKYQNISGPAKDFIEVIIANDACGTRE